MTMMKYVLLAPVAITLCFSTPVHGQDHHDYQVIAPPAEMHLAKFYGKYVSASGYPIISSTQVNDYALKEAAFLVDTMLAERPDVRAAMIKNGSRMIVMAYNEYTTDVPEHSKMRPKNFWDVRARGLGGSNHDPVCSCG